MLLTSLATYLTAIADLLGRWLAYLCVILKTTEDVETILTTQQLRRYILKTVKGMATEPTLRIAKTKTSALSRNESYVSMDKSTKQCQRIS